MLKAFLSGICAGASQRRPSRLLHLQAGLGTLWRRLRRPPEPPERPVERLLVVGYAAIGDLIFFLPALEALRARYPQARLVWLANRYPTTTELLPATGWVDDVWLFDWETEDRAAINRRIAEARFDLAVLTLSAPCHVFEPALAGIPLRAGHRRAFEPGLSAWTKLKRGLVTGEFSRRLLLNRAVELPEGPVHALERNLELLAALGIPRPPDPRPKLPVRPEHRRAARERAGAGRPVGIHLGAPGGAYGKMWAPERFAALARRLAEKAGLDFVLLGGPEEEPALAAYRAAGGPGRSLIGELSLLESFAAVELCRLFISNDTGLAKAAMALGVPTVTFWGPSDPAEYGAAWDADRHLDLRTGIGCSPCSRQGMPRPHLLNYTVCGHRDCLGRLEPDWAAARVLERYAPLLEVSAR